MKRKKRRNAVKRITQEARAAHARGDHSRVKEVARRAINGHGCPKATKAVLVDLVILRKDIPQLQAAAWAAFARDPDQAGLRRIARHAEGAFHEEAFRLLTAKMKTTKQLRSLRQSLPRFRRELIALMHHRKKGG